MRAIISLSLSIESVSPLVGLLAAAPARSEKNLASSLCPIRIIWGIAACVPKREKESGHSALCLAGASNCYIQQLIVNRPENEDHFV